MKKMFHLKLPMCRNFTGVKVFKTSICVWLDDYLSCDHSVAVGHVSQLSSKRPPLKL